MYTFTRFRMVLHSMDLPSFNQFSKDGHFVSGIFLFRIVLQWLLTWTASETVVWEATTSEGEDMEISGVVISPHKEADNKYFQQATQPLSHLFISDLCSCSAKAAIIG